MRQGCHPHWPAARASVGESQWQGSGSIHSTLLPSSHSLALHSCPFHSQRPKHCRRQSGSGCPSELFFILFIPLVCMDGEVLHYIVTTSP